VGMAPPVIIKLLNKISCPSAYVKPGSKLDLPCCRPDCRPPVVMPSAKPILSCRAQRGISWPFATVSRLYSKLQIPHPAEGGIRNDTGGGGLEWCWNDAGRGALGMTAGRAPVYRCHARRPPAISSACLKPLNDRLPHPRHHQPQGPHRRRGRGVVGARRNGDRPKYFADISHC
jgi:hypothetical protein